MFVLWEEVNFEVEAETRLFEVGRSDVAPAESRRRNARQAPEASRSHERDFEVGSEWKLAQQHRIQ